MRETVAPETPGRAVGWSGSYRVLDDTSGRHLRVAALFTSRIRNSEAVGAVY